jgi:hypothetical protein
MKYFCGKVSSTFPKVKYPVWGILRGFQRMSIFFENVQLLPFDKLLEPVEDDKINHVQSNFLWEKLEEKQVYIIFA